MIVVHVSSLLGRLGSTFTRAENQLTNQRRKVASLTIPMAIIKWFIASLFEGAGGMKL